MDRKSWQDKVGYHITPDYGLMNDPNGLIKFKDDYHVFYQLNPNGFVHKNKSWGHMVSTNMVDWEQQPIALHPDSWFDKDGVYSGCAIEHEEKIYLFYTGNVIDDGVNKSYQCGAVSEDGQRFEKLGPIMEHPAGYTRHVRDPKVFKSPFQADEWYMVLGAQTNDLKADLLVYKSSNLLEWELLYNLRSDHDTELGYMLECPDLIKIDDQYVLVASPQGLKKEDYRFQNRYHSGYFICDFFEDGSIKLLQPFKELDHGFEFYAPQTFRDGNQNILYAWMGVMEDEQERLVPTIESSGWLHNLTIPRFLELKEGELRQQPAAALSQLREGKGNKMTFDKAGHFPLQSLQTEIILTFEKETDQFNLTLDRLFSLSFQLEEGVLSFIRQSWVTDEKEQRKLLFDEGLKEVRIFIDHSIVEIFINGGAYVFSSRIFSRAGSTNELSFEFSKKTSSMSLQVFDLKTVDFSAKAINYV